MQLSFQGARWLEAPPVVGVVPMTNRRLLLHHFLPYAGLHTTEKQQQLAAISSMCKVTLISECLLDFEYHMYL